RRAGNDVDGYGEVLPVRAARLIVRRSRTRANLLLSLLAVTAIAVFLLAGMVGYLRGAADVAVRDTIVDGPARAVATQLTARLAADSAQQTDAIVQLIDDAFAGVDVTVHRTVRSNPAEAAVGEQSVDLILMVDSGL